MGMVGIVPVIMGMVGIVPVIMGRTVSVGFGLAFFTAHPHIGRSDARLDHSFHAQPVIAKPNRHNGLLNYVFGHASIDKRAHAHISSDTARTVEVQVLASNACTHDSFLLMRAATIAAPMPLSILTTERPGAQLLSIPARAA